MRIPLLAIGACAVALVGCNPQAKNQRSADAAQQHFDQADFAAAEIEAKNVLARDSQHPEALRTLGLIWARQGAVLEGGKVLWEAHRLLPADDEVAIELARAMLAAGFAADSRKQLEEILARTPGQPEALVLLAEAAATPADINACAAHIARAAPAENSALIHAKAVLELRRGNQDAARALAERAVALKPESPRALALLGNIHRQQGQLASAVGLLRQAARLAPPRSPEPLAYAALLNEQGESEEAAALLAVLTEKTPDYLPAWRMRAALAASRGNHHDAQLHLARVLAKAPADIEAALLQGQLLTRLGKPQEAIELLERLTTTYPFRPTISVALARAYLAATDQRRAAGILDEVLSAAPNLPEATLLRAEIHLQQGAPESAVRLADALAASDPGNRGAQDLLVRAHARAGEPAKGLAILERQAAAFPGDPAIPLARGHLLVASGQRAEARAAFEHSLELSGGALPAVAALVSLDLAENNPAAALARARGWSAGQPRSPDAHILLASVYQSLGELPAAETELAIALNLAPEHPDAWAMRARIELDSGRRAEAVGTLRELLAIHPGHAEAWMQLGGLLRDLGRTSEARASFEALSKLHPHSAAAFNNLAVIDAQTPGGLTQAAAHARRAYALDPANCAVNHTLGQIEWQLGNYRDALARLAEAAAGMPSDAQVQQDLGLAYYSMNQVAAATAAFERAVALAPAEATEAARHLAWLRATALPERAVLERHVQENRGDLVAILRLARCLSDLGEPNKALAHYAQALAINPDLEDAYLGEAEIFRALDQPEKALEAANHARRVAPQSPRALAALGLANFRLGRHRQAHTQLADAAALLPDDAALQRAFALATYSIGNLDAARSGMAKLVDDHRPLAEEAREFLTLTDPLAPANRNAIALAEQRLAADPHDVPALMLHATREGQSPAQRAATYSQILKSFPEFDPARIALARLLMDDPRQLDAAESLAHAARQHRGDDPQVSAVLAIVSFRKGKYPQAAQLLTELAAARPLSPTELAALGVSQARTSRAADARLTLTAAIAAGLTGPDSALAAATLAELEEPER